MDAVSLTSLLIFHIKFLTLFAGFLFKRFGNGLIIHLKVVPKMINFSTNCFHLKKKLSTIIFDIKYQQLDVSYFLDCRNIKERIVKLRYWKTNTARLEHRNTFKQKKF